MTPDGLMFTLTFTPEVSLEPTIHLFGWAEGGEPENRTWTHADVGRTSHASSCPSPRPGVTIFLPNLQRNCSFQLKWVKGCSICNTHEIHWGFYSYISTTFEYVFVYQFNLSVPTLPRNPDPSIQRETGYNYSILNSCLSPLFCSSNMPELPHMTLLLRLWKSFTGDHLGDWKAAFSEPEDRAYVLHIFHWGWNKACDSKRAS